MPCKIIPNGPPHGKGYVLRTGFRSCQYNTIIILDGDYSHRPEDIPVLIKEFEKGFGLVIGNRMAGGNDEYNFLRKLGNNIATFIFNSLFGVYISDALNGFKILDRIIVDMFEYTSRGLK